MGPGQAPRSEVMLKNSSPGLRKRCQAGTLTATSKKRLRSYEKGSLLRAIIFRWETTRAFCLAMGAHHLRVELIRKAMRRRSNLVILEMLYRKVSQVKKSRSILRKTCYPLLILNFGLLQGGNSKQRKSSLELSLGVDRLARRERKSFAYKTRRFS